MAWRYRAGQNQGGQRVGLGAARAIRALWARPVHALSVLDEMPEHARGRGRGGQLTDPG